MILHPVISIPKNLQVPLCKLLVPSTMAPVYLTKEQRDAALAETDDIGGGRGPGGCPGFAFELPDILRYGEPLEDVHIDSRTEKPVTILCTHGENGRQCQRWAEYAYILLLAYAKGQLPNWKQLFPNHDTPMFRGKPAMSKSPRFHDCPGFILCKGPGTRKYDLNICDMIKMTYEVDPVTLAAYTKQCGHLPCDVTSVWKWALYRAFAMDLLEEIDFDRTEEEPIKGMPTFAL